MVVEELVREGRKDSEVEVRLWKERMRAPYGGTLHMRRHLGSFFNSGRLHHGRSVVTEIMHARSREHHYEKFTQQSKLMQKNHENQLNYSRDRIRR